jgi:hypothetical protein
MIDLGEAGQPRMTTEMPTHDPTFRAKLYKLAPSVRY